MDYVTDTHSLVWFFTDDDKLSTAANQAFQASGGINHSARCCSRNYFIAKKGRILLSLG